MVIEGVKRGQRTPQGRYLRVGRVTHTDPGANPLLSTGGWVRCKSGNPNNNVRILAILAAKRSVLTRAIKAQIRAFGSISPNFHLSLNFPPLSHPLILSYLSLNLTPTSLSKNLGTTIYSSAPLPCSWTPLSGFLRTQTPMSLNCLKHHPNPEKPNQQPINKSLDVLNTNQQSKILDT